MFLEKMLWGLKNYKLDIYNNNLVIAYKYPWKSDWVILDKETSYEEFNHAKKKLHLIL